MTDSREFHDGRHDGLVALESLDLDRVTSFADLLRGMSRTAMTRRLVLVLALAVPIALAGCSNVAAPSSAPLATSTPSPAPSPVGATAPATPSSEPSSRPAPTTWQPLSLFPEADGPFDLGMAMSDTRGFIVVARAHDRRLGGG